MITKMWGPILDKLATLPKQEIQKELINDPNKFNMILEGVKSFDLKHLQKGVLRKGFTDEHDTLKVIEKEVQDNLAIVTNAYQEVKGQIDAKLRKIKKKKQDELKAAKKIEMEKEMKRLKKLNGTEMTEDAKLFGLKDPNDMVEVSIKDYFLKKGWGWPIKEFQDHDAAIKAEEQQERKEDIQKIDDDVKNNHYPPENCFFEEPVLTQEQKINKRREMSNQIKKDLKDDMIDLLKNIPEGEEKEKFKAIWQSDDVDYFNGRRELYQEMCANGKTQYREYTQEQIQQFTNNEYNNNKS